MESIYSFELICIHRFEHAKAFSHSNHSVPIQGGVQIKFKDLFSTHDHFSVNLVYSSGAETCHHDVLTSIKMANSSVIHVFILHLPRGLFSLIIFSFFSTKCADCIQPTSLMLLTSDNVRHVFWFFCVISPSVMSKKKQTPISI